MTRARWAAAVALCALGCAQTARLGRLPEDCNRATEQPVVHVRLPGNPFMAVATRDGCWVFVSMLAAERDARPGIAIIHRSDGRLGLARVASDVGTPAGLALTHDGAVLIAAARDRVEFLDVRSLISGDGNPILGAIIESTVVGAISATVTSNDSLAFVSYEHGEMIKVIDLFETRRRHFRDIAVMGHVPVLVPISVVLSPDERLLYATAMTMPPSLGWPAECHGLAANAPATARVPRGAIVVIDVSSAARASPNAVIAAVPAGCSPVRLALSPDGETAYVTARWDNALLAFDTRRLRSDASHALLARIPVGSAPVGVLAVDGGRRVLVANSNRFAGDTADRQTLTVVDAQRLTAGAAAVVATIPAGSFPRELRTTSDGRTLLLTNFGSRTLEVVDLARVP